MVSSAQTEGHPVARRLVSVVHLPPLRLTFRRRWLVTALAAVTVVGILYFFAAVTAEELLRPLYDPIQRTISELAIGPFGFLQTSAFIALGLSLLALQHALYRRLRHSLLSRIALVLLGLCGIASFLAAAFPTDLKGAVVTLAGTIHDLAASFGYGALIIAMILLTLHFRRERHWRSFVLSSSSLSAVGVGASIFLGLTNGSDIMGLSQRAMAVPLLLWVVLTALHTTHVNRELARELAKVGDARDAER
jgi:Protein of unknown function (DUF998)